MKIPQKVTYILGKLNERGFEAYIVGGCVRDLLLDKEPSDWDIATNALPEQIQEIFPDSFYVNKFGTVTVKTDNPKEALKEIEVTTYRIDEKYTDKRHPDAVHFTNKLEEDLARRDFTINAMALALTRQSAIGNRQSAIGTDKKTRKLTTDPTKERIFHGVDDRQPISEITDLFDGQKDLKRGLIRAVGDPEKRFAEDALRLMRAVRFACQLGFEIEPKTAAAIKKNAGWLQAIAKERIGDELVKILMTTAAFKGITLLQELGLLQFVIPELQNGIGILQNRHHIYTIFEHGVLSLKFAAQKNYNLIVRLAALFHDIAKPQTKRGEGPSATFYNHDILGAKYAIRILERLRFPKEITEQTANLIRHHMFVYDIGTVTAAGVRRLLRRAGPENINDLIALRVADRLGSGVPKAQPYRLRHFQYMAEKVQHDPLSVKMLKINGHDIMAFLQIEPGPKIGAILDVLLAEVVEEPQKNSPDYLKSRAGELNKIDLTSLRQMAKEKIDEKREEEDKVIKTKYWVG